MQTNEMNYTPRGLTQNWHFIQENSKARKGKKGGPFESRKEAYCQKALGKRQETPEPIRLAAEAKPVAVRVKKSGEAYWQPRDKETGKVGKALTISASLAAKLGLSN